MRYKSAHICGIRLEAQHNPKSSRNRAYIRMTVNRSFCMNTNLIQRTSLFGYLTYDLNKRLLNKYRISMAIYQDSQAFQLTTCTCQPLASANIDIVSYETWTLIGLYRFESTHATSSLWLFEGPRDSSAVQNTNRSTE